MALFIKKIKKISLSNFALHFNSPPFSLITATCVGRTDYVSVATTKRSQRLIQ